MLFYQVVRVKTAPSKDAVISAVDNNAGNEKKTGVNKEIVENIISKGSFENVFKGVYKNGRETGR